MSRRVPLPGADELFRSTAPAGQAVPEPEEPASPRAAPAASYAAPAPVPAGPTLVPQASQGSHATRPEDETDDDYGPPPVRRRPRPVGERRPTGRERHDEKITVYCSAEELIDIERARLTLRGEYGLAADRGRIVREALALVLADLETKGEQSVLVRRLRGR